MITRAQIRRQLRKNGGIMNAVPRQGYFLGKLVRGVKKGVDKVLDVGSQVIKSPVGKAALLGLGAYGLCVGFGGNFGIGNIGPRIGQGLSAVRSGLFGSIAPNLRAPGMPSFLGETGFTRTGGILGKLGLTKGGGSMALTGLGKLTGGAGLLTYFMSKGKTEEEAKELAQDVYRGEGLGLDLIQADMQKYRSGDADASQMFSKGYRFLTPRNYMQAATGGRVGLANGSEGVEQMYLSDEAGVIPKKGNKGITKEDRNLTKEDFDSDKNYKRYIRQQNKKAQGGRIKKYGGGVTAAMPRIPTGMPRVNAGGISELDYRQEGGFVPMGVKEKADDVPAMLSKNEFVMTADAVKGAGGGNVEKGAQKMYNTMKQLEGRIS